MAVEWCDRYNLGNANSSSWLALRSSFCPREELFCELSCFTLCPEGLSKPSFFSKSWRSFSFNLYLRRVRFSDSLSAPYTLGRFWDFFLHSVQRWQSVFIRDITGPLSKTGKSMRFIPLVLYFFFTWGRRHGEQGFHGIFELTRSISESLLISSSPSRSAKEHVFLPGLCIFLFVCWTVQSSSAHVLICSCNLRTLLSCWSETRRDISALLTCLSIKPFRPDGCLLSLAVWTESFSQGCTLTVDSVTSLLLWFSLFSRDRSGSHSL